MSKIITRKSADVIDYSLINNMDFENNVATEPDDFFDRLSDYGIKSSDLSGIHKRTQTTTEMIREERGPCSGVLIGGPFIKSICGFKRNLSD